MKLALILGSMAQKANASGGSERRHPIFSDRAESVLVARTREENRYGLPSSAIYAIDHPKHRLYWLYRHGEDELPIPPHLINSRANLYALRQLGVGAVISINSVGSICRDCPPGTHTLLTQVIDYTWGRAHTFFDGRSEPGEFESHPHIDFTEPFSLTLARSWRNAMRDVSLPLVQRRDAVCAITQGPRLESRAEIEGMRRAGAEFVNMTLMPELALARECGMDYLAHAFVCNWAAGFSKERSIDLAQCERLAAVGIEQSAQIVHSLWQRLTATPA